MSLSQGSFEAVVGMFERVSGIRLVAAKKPLVEGRLQRLAQQAGHARLDDYVHQLMQAASPEELTRVIDKLTTNETYFFREPQHFDHLKAQLPELMRGPGSTGGTLRLWSAASSSGEEAYSLAMLLDEELGASARWEIAATDLSTAMVRHGRRALYPMERARNLSPARLKRHCLRGTGEYEGQVLVQRQLRERVRFDSANLMRDLPRTLGSFDVIFLRNVLIYFDPPAKAAIVRRVLGQLKPDGLLYTGHAESLSNLDLPVRAVATAVYAHAA
ncbi:CheR family methyltransferase [Leptothrix discophora]|uniref:Chemotaxis protein methyltransferase n=1 Tax=Leptothrix discophora TaxID=89 RepID=A0ABT9G6X6_LEPDI|nr:protein-glutamate O-methyltransferase CheR [Leptothrix discophora]MDP4302156.1 protein-glutamate O-methyltransferase CheR [Leptothrix discophora]